MSGHEEKTMTAIRGYVPPSTDEAAIGVHSLDQFVLAVPDLATAQRFYRSFGLDVLDSGNGLELNTFGHDHRWGTVVEGGSKRLHHLSFGCYAEDLATLRSQAEAGGAILLDPPPGFESNGFWFQNPDGIPVEVKVAPKVSPDRKLSGPWTSCPEGVAAAPPRSKAWTVQPRRLSHVLCFTPDIDRAIDFHTATLGLRLSDRSDFVAFMHGIHGSDHHVLAFAKSDAPGFHHCSWDVPSIDDIGLGAAVMADKGYTKGWGLGRHVLGSNYFHYVRDPWGSFAEYSCDIDYIPRSRRWVAGTHAPEDSLSLWGPEPPDYFIANYEGTTQLQT
jgi:catechol 2,3-dioxygenase-like lactoylglutathione lyase family enzyme